MTKQELNQWIDNNLVDITPYIIRLGYKYAWEDKYRYSNEYIYPDPHINMWIWDNDWYEGENDIVVEEYIKLEDVFDTHKY